MSSKLYIRLFLILAAYLIYVLIYVISEQLPTLLRRLEVPIEYPEQGR